MGHEYKYTKEDEKTMQTIRESINRIKVYNSDATASGEFYIEEWGDMNRKKPTSPMDELILESIKENPKVKKMLIDKIEKAVAEVDIDSIVAESISGVIESVFENDSVYELVENSIKDRIVYAMNTFFKEAVFRNGT